MLALAHLVTDGDIDGDDGALDRRGDPGRAVRSPRRHDLVRDVRRRAVARVIESLDEIASG
jgi:hypothetical protein